MLDEQAQQVTNTEIASENGGAGDGLPVSFSDAPVGFSEKEAPRSLIDLVKGDLEQLAALDHVDIPIPGYDSSGLRVRYRAPRSGRELSNLTRPILREFRNDDYGRNLAIAIDLMIELSEGLYILHPDTRETITFDPDLSGIPLNFNFALVEALGWNADELNSSRKVVKKLFDNNDVAILSHADELNNWLKNKRYEVGLGE